MLAKQSGHCANILTGTWLWLGQRATHWRLVTLGNVKLGRMSKHMLLDIHIPQLAAWGPNPPIGPSIVQQWPGLVKGQDQYLQVHIGSHFQQHLCLDSPAFLCPASLSRGMLGPVGLHGAAVTGLRAWILGLTQLTFLSV